MFVFVIQNIVKSCWYNVSKCIETDSFAMMLAVFLFALCFVRVLQLIIKLKSLPPGPWGIPVFGVLPTMSRLQSPFEHYLKLKDTYGSLFSIKVGSQLHVYISDYKMIRDLFRKEELSGRPPGPFHSLLSGYGKFFFCNRQYFVTILCKNYTH